MRWISTADVGTQNMLVWNMVSDGQILTTKQLIFFSFLLSFLPWAKGEGLYHKPRPCALTRHACVTERLGCPKHYLHTHRVFWHTPTHSYTPTELALRCQLPLLSCFIFMPGISCRKDKRRLQTYYPPLGFFLLHLRSFTESKNKFAWRNGSEWVAREPDPCGVNGGSTKWTAN